MKKYDIFEIFVIIIVIISTLIMIFPSLFIDLFSGLINNINPESECIREESTSNEYDNLYYYYDNNEEDESLSYSEKLILEQQERGRIDAGIVTY